MNSEKPLSLSTIKTWRQELAEREKRSHKSDAFMRLSKKLALLLTVKATVIGFWKPENQSISDLATTNGLEWACDKQDWIRNEIAGEAVNIVDHDIPIFDPPRSYGTRKENSVANVSFFHKKKSKMGQARKCCQISTHRKDKVRTTRIMVGQTTGFEKSIFVSMGC